MPTSQANPFVPVTPGERQQMLDALGFDSPSALFESVPEALRYPEVTFPPRLSEMELVAHMRELAGMNRPLSEQVCVLGAGLYRHYVPPLPATLVLQPAFLPAYQLSQAEMHQGLLQLMYEFQELICILTGMEVANCGLYDGASALAEAVLMALRLTGRRRVLIARSAHPETRAVLRTYTGGLPVTVSDIPFDATEGTIDLEGLDEQLDDDVACVVVQQPNFFGVLDSLGPVVDAARQRGALAIAMADPIALALLRPPGEDGFDVVVGEGQPLGHDLNFGGAHFGYMATREEWLHQLPGLYVVQGETREGESGYTLAQQAKSARTVLREKAPTNVGTSSVIPALVGGAYLAAMGPDGLRRAAVLSQERARAAAATLVEVLETPLRFRAPFFREFALRAPTALDPQQVALHMRQHEIVGPYTLASAYPELNDCLLFCFTEMNRASDIERVAGALSTLIG